MQKQTKLLHRGSLVITVATATLFALAVPAVAVSGSGSGGSGTLTTDLTIQQVPPQAFCFVAGNNFGSTTTISGTLSQGNASYTGPITFDWVVDQTNGPWYEGLDETHGTSATCNNGSAGDPWDITGTASGTNAAGSTVNCTFTSGTYTRSNDVDIVVTLEGDCDIQEDPPDGTDSVTNSGTQVSLLQTVGECTDEVPPAFVPEYCACESDSFTAESL